ncbi:hypothetical protein WOLCODRAFT_161974 [Wolfiporia cocos MD-104 SS10]|uniref:Uncharacterized protein n=1 Tax=Wolfiporia cocos (strain MD-104) TaxID=742152 RepID=A0A2H3JCF0_WOLCO|nr:hypothetical protein WOLCODRAFT_161974 [Wolfiporia cocos MD-104 SS10]
MSLSARKAPVSRPSLLARFTSYTTAFLDKSEADQASLFPSEERNATPMSGSPTSSVLSLPIAPPQSTPAEISLKRSEDLQRQLDNSNVALKSKTAEATALESRVRELEALLSTSRAETEAAQTALRAQEEARARAEETCSGLRVQLEEARAESTRHSSELTIAHDELAEWRNAEESRAAELDAERASRLRAESELEASREENRQIDAARAEATAEAESSATQLRDASVYIEDLTALCASLKAENATGSARVDELSHAVETEREGRERAESDVKDALGRIESLEAQLEQEKSQLTRVKSEQEDQEVRHREDISAMKTEHERLLQEAVQQTKNDAETKHSEETQFAISRLATAHQATLQKLEQQHRSAFLSTVRSSETRLSERDVQIKSLQEELAQSRADLGAATHQLRIMRVELDAAREREAVTDQQRMIGDVLPKSLVPALATILMSVNASVRVVKQIWERPGPLHF